MTNRGYIASCVCALSLLSAALSCTPASAASAAEAAPRQEVMVSVPLSRLTELQSLISRQEQRLNQLQELLSGQSSGLSQQQAAQAGVNDCQKLVDELIQNNQRAKCILDELIRGAQTGAVQDATH